MAEITDTQALLADENPNILSDLNTGSTPTTLTAPPAAAEATNIATDLSSQLYGSGVVGALEENRNAAIDELGQYDEMLNQNYSPFPSTPYYTPNPADMSSALAGMSGMTAQNTARIAGAVDTTERAYNTAIANVLDRFTRFQEMQQAQRQFEQQMELEKQRLQLEREKMSGGGGGKGDFDMNAAMNALLGLDQTGEGDLSTLMTDAAGGGIADNAAMQQMRLANAMRYARTPAEALQIKELHDLFYGNQSQQLTPEQLALGTTLRGEFMSKTKDFEDSYDSYTRVQNLDQSPAGDTTLLYNYIRLVDPGSFVTGNELATMENAAAGSDRIKKLYQKAIKGTLPSKQREDLKKQIENIYRGREETYKQKVQQYANLADQYQIPRQLVVMNLLGEGFGLAMLEDQMPFAGGTTDQLNQQVQQEQKPSLQEIFGPAEQTPQEQNRNLQEQEQRRPSIWESLGVYLPGNQRRVA